MFDSKPPSPKKKLPELAVTLAAVTEPVAEIKPVVRKFPACTLPVALTDPALTKAEVTTLPPVTLPVADTCPAVRRLPPVTLPVTLSVVPTVAALAISNVPLLPRARATS